MTIPMTAAEEEKFIEWADAQFNGSAYDKIVSDEKEEVEGMQRDLDDFDIYRYSQQDALDEDSFWDKIFEYMLQEFGDNGVDVPDDEMLNWLERQGESIAIDAFENFDPSEEFCIHVGHWKPESYWRA